MLAIATVLLHGASACISDGEDKLNPQPLPPGEPDERGPPAQGGTDNGADPTGPFTDAGLGSVSEGGSDADAGDAEAGQ